MPCAMPSAPVQTPSPPQSKAVLLTTAPTTLAHQLISRAIPSTTTYTSSSPRITVAHRPLPTVDHLVVAYLGEPPRGPPSTSLISIHIQCDEQITAKIVQVGTARLQAGTTGQTPATALCVIPHTLLAPRLYLNNKPPSKDA